MTPLLQPNVYSCLATCAAMILDTTPGVVFEELKHDGSEEWGENSHRGFHVDEILTLLLSHDVLGIRYELMPMITDKSIWSPEKCTERLLALLSFYSEGILIGKKGESQHAWCWNAGSLIDPAGQSVTLGEIEMCEFIGVLQFRD